METTASKVLKIFYCYARKDKPLRDEMDLHLSALKRQNSVITWADHEIAPGEDWAKSIDSHLNDADIVFLLVSPHFMGSDYSYGIEMKRALERHEQRQARVVPIILRPVDWEDAPFSKLQVLPTNAQPVTSWPDRDTAFADIVKNLRPMIKDLRNQLKTKEDWLAEAQTLLKQDRHEEALAPLSQALTLDANFILALIYRGGAYKQLFDYEKAIIDFDHALSLGPKNPTLLMLRGDTYRLQGNYSKALADLNQSLALGPHDPSTLARRGETHRITGHYEEALVDLDQALALAPKDTFALASRGDTHRLMGNYKQALADFRHALSLDPHNATLLTKRGDTYRLMLDYRKALIDFNEALALNPRFSDALARRGDTYRSLHDYERALTDLNKALDQNSDDAWTLVARAETYQRTHQFVEALADFSRAIALEDDDWHLYKRGIVLSDGHRDFTRAIELARLRSSRTSSMIERWRIAFNLALYHFALGKIETAKVLYENIVSLCSSPAQLQDAAHDLEDYFDLLAYVPIASSLRKEIEFQKDVSRQIRQQMLERVTEIEQEAKENASE